MPEDGREQWGVENGRTPFRQELELELGQPHMAQKPMLRGEVGVRSRLLPGAIFSGFSACPPLIGVFLLLLLVCVQLANCKNKLLPIG